MSEFHITIDNRIKTANKLIIQTCRLCHLKNRSCFVSQRCRANVHLVRKRAKSSNNAKFCRRIILTSSKTTTYTHRRKTSFIFSSFISQTTFSLSLLSVLISQTTLSSSRQTIRSTSHSSQTLSILMIILTSSLQQTH